MPHSAPECLVKFDKSMANRKSTIYVVLFIAEIEMLFYSGILYGLNVLIPSLKREKYFFDLCSPMLHSANASCVQQNQLFGYNLITGITAFSISSLPLGIFFDKFGYKYTKIFCSLLCFFGCLLFALSSVIKSEMLFPAMLVLGVSAQSLAVCNLPLGGLVPDHETLIVALYVGSFDTSVIVFIFINLSYLSGFSLLASFLIMAFTGLALMELDAFLLMGAVDQIKVKSLKSVTSKNKIGMEDIASGTDEVQASGAVIKEPDTLASLNAYRDSIYPGLKQILSSRYFLIQLMFYIIVFFRFSFFLAQLSIQLDTGFVSNHNMVLYLLSVSSYFFMTSIGIAPISGIIVDALKARIKPMTDPVQLYKTTLSTFGIPLIICCVTNELMAIFIVVAENWAIYIAYMSLTVARAFLFTLTASFILTAFPVKYFGMLFGITVTTGGVISFIQYALLINDLTSLNIVNYVLIAISAFTFVHPILLLIKL
uniref:Slc43a-2 n=1 Tax=Schmidtea mediterranea TaxID=79327 RepID=A0A0H3YJL7_SCHMD|nr:slc43a-2 [Schmidtea mediterranea]